ncbi:hypothetical protein [Phaeobacter sp. HF9A]|uniref:hypothetical protein n=1 Tax=Phaeobacter sp. HF9A TaxID=2721561 RepID=UPI00142F9D7B|nr:hypothetical protein [Phaeobacter sp. HF9A]NIZ13045.1 hypothetical protein [Phaeobacter sp. HF9A]
MTPLSLPSDQEVIDAFFAEHTTAEPVIDAMSDDTSIDRLIAQLEASFATATQLSEPARTKQGSLRDAVRDLATRLEEIATDLALINQQLND